jgi:hypothetical protein
VIARRKGVAVRRGLKEAWSKGASRWTSRIRRFGGFSYEEPNSDGIPSEAK